MGFMQEALEEARVAARVGEVPVGAVVVRRGAIIARSGNRTERDHDPAGHAEIVVLRTAAALLGSTRLPDCDLYVTLEPCAMCAAAIAQARIKRLYFGATDPKGGAVESGVRLYGQPSCHHAPEVYGGLDAEASSSLLRDFFAARR